MNRVTPSLPPPGTRENAIAVRCWRLTSWIAAAFTLLVGLGMVTAHLRLKSSDPWRSPVLLDLKEQLRSHPKDEALKSRIRDMDLNLRERYFQLLSFKSAGIYLLFSGAAVFLLTSSQVRRLTSRLPMPQPNPDAAATLARHCRLSRNAVGALGVVALAALGALAFTRSSSPLHDQELLEALLAGEGPEAVPTYTVTEAELRANWPCFRGYEGSGVTDDKTVLSQKPMVIWQVPVPAKGFNSPILWKGQLFFTGGDATLREVFCLDAVTGGLKWRQPVQVASTSNAKAREIPDMTGYAASSSATDGERVYAVFATGEIAAFSLDGQPVWAKNFGPLDNTYGHASSLATWRDQVIVVLDQGYEDSRKSKILCLAGATGEILWQTPRPVGASWTTPIVVEAAGKPQIITLSLPWAIAYSPADGSELWRAGPIDGEVTPSPVFGGGRVFVVNPGMYQLLAIRPDGNGDVSKTHIVWTADGDLPDITSPVSNGELVFTINSGGSLTCFDAETGQQVWQHELEAEFQSSPSLAGKTLCVLSVEGEFIAVQAGREFRELWRMKLEDKFHASPAFADGRMYLKGDTNVWCLAGPGKEVVQP